VDGSVSARRASRGIFNGTVIVVVCLLAAGVAGYMYLSRTGVLTRVASLDRVVIVFASHAEDGAEVAQVVAQVTDEGRTVRLLDPQEAVTIPGTSYDRLADAYPFGGGQAVADALTGPKGVSGAYVDVQEARWIALLQRGAAVEVDLPKPLEVFDGTRLVSFAEGTQAVPAVDVPALLRGVAYLGTTERMRVVEAVGEASLAALAREGATAGARTDLTAEAYAKLIAALRAR
jgi:hypothetical protein